MADKPDPKRLYTLVIPAKAGTHFTAARAVASAPGGDDAMVSVFFSMGPGFRRDDDVRGGRA